MTTARVDPTPADYSAEELSQMRRFAALSFAQKVQWLEAAHRLALLWNARRPEAEKAERGSSVSEIAAQSPEKKAR